MSDELKPRESIDTPEFRALLDVVIFAPHHDPAKAALIAHIDAWGARMAGDATERAAKVCEDRAMFWHAEETTYAAGKKAGAIDAAERIRKLAAAPTHDKEDA